MAEKKQKINDAVITGAPGKDKNAEDAIKFPPTLDGAFASLEKKLNAIKRGETTPNDDYTQATQRTLDAVHALTSFDPGTGDQGVNNALQILRVLRENNHELTIDEVSEMNADAQTVANISSENPREQSAAQNQIATRISQFNQQRKMLKAAKGDFSKVVRPENTRPLLGAVNKKIAGKIESTVGKKILSQVVSKGVSAIVAAIPGLQVLAPVIGKIAGWLSEKLIWPLLKRSKEISALGLGITGTGLLLGSPLVTGIGAATTALGAGLGGGAAITGGFSTLFSLPGLIFMESLAALGVALLALLVGGTLFVALTLFIINSGAYIVPPNTQGPVSGFVQTEAGTITGSCPVPGGIVAVGSFRGVNVGGHGSNPYWDDVTSIGFNRCFAIPTGVTACTANNFTGSYCYIAGANCPQYGFAADVVYPGVDPAMKFVYFPSINGQDLNWVQDSVGSYCGSGYTYRAEDGANTYELFLLHLAPGAAESGRSGQAIGRMINYTDPNGSCIGRNNEHVHIEMRVNDQYVRPDSLCNGSGGTTPAPIPLPNCTDHINQGWVVSIPRSQAAQIMASTGTNGIYDAVNTCAWAAAEGLQYAVNANFYRCNGQPIGPAGDGGNITNYRPEGSGVNACREVQRVMRVFSLNNSGAPSITRYDTMDLFPTSSVRLAVSGIDGLQDYLFAEPNRRTGRTLIAYDNQNIYLVVFRGATPAEAHCSMINLDMNNYFFLDSGTSTTLCQGGSTTYGGARSVPMSIGVSAGASIRTVGE